MTIRLRRPQTMKTISSRREKVGPVLAPATRTIDHWHQSTATLVRTDASKYRRSMIGQAHTIRSAFRGACPSNLRTCLKSRRRPPSPWTTRSSVPRTEFCKSTHNLHLAKSLSQRRRASISSAKCVSEICTMLWTSSAASTVATTISAGPATEPWS